MLKKKIDKTYYSSNYNGHLLGYYNPTEHNISRHILDGGKKDLLLVWLCIFKNATSYLSGGVTGNLV